MNQYIITEEIICEGCNCCPRDGKHKKECCILSNVRSHPYQSARDKVLDKLETFCDINNTLIYDEESEESEYWIVLGEIRAKIEELRQKAGE